MQKENPFAEKELAGGHLALDFANTVGQHEPEVLNEWLGAYDDLVWWSLRAGSIDQATADALLHRASANPDEAARVFARAIALREAIYRVFSALGAGGEAPAAELATVNRELALAMPHARIVAGADGLEWGWEGSELDRVLWPIARAAAELLTSGELGRIGECAGETCQWLYFDTSRNHSRRWCVMSDCGNRAKARRHYHRVRSEVKGG